MDVQYLFFELLDFGLGYAVFYLKLDDKENLLKTILVIRHLRMVQCAFD